MDFAAAFLALAATFAAARAALTTAACPLRTAIFDLVLESLAVSEAMEAMVVLSGCLTGMHSRLNTGIFGAALFWGSARNAEIRAREAAEEIVEFLEIEGIRAT